MNALGLNTKPLNNYTFYGAVEILESAPVTDGTASTASVGAGSTVHGHRCQGTTLPFTWGLMTCVQAMAVSQGNAAQNGVGNVQIVEPISQVSGTASTSNFGSMAIVQPVARVSGTAFSSSFAIGACVQPLAICRAESVAQPLFDVLDFDRQSVSAGSLTNAPAFTILEFVRD